MIISDEEHFEFIQNGQRYNLEKLQEVFPEDSKDE